MLLDVGFNELRSTQGVQMKSRAFSVLYYVEVEGQPHAPVSLSPADALGRRSAWLRPLTIVMTSLSYSLRQSLGNTSWMRSRSLSSWPRFTACKKKDDSFSAPALQCNKMGEGPRAG